MSDLIRTFSERGDLAHLALFLWAACASAYALFALRELAASARRFDDSCASWRASTTRSAIPARGEGHAAARCRQDDAA